MNSYSKLLGNSFVFAIGNLGSKLVTLILVPLYTYYLSTVEYGTVDLVVITANMLLPIVSSSVFDAVLRFVMDNNEEKDGVLSNSIFIASIGYLIMLLLFPILNYYNVMQDSLIYLYFILLVQIFEQIFSQYTRAVGKIKLFAVNGILLSVATALLNIVSLIYLGLGIQGYFLSIIFANLISIFFLVISTKAYKAIHVSSLNKIISVRMLKYSIPLIPNSLMWWLINASSRYFILYFVGVGANGLFAVASKIPSLINIINQIFTQAWQLSAIEEYHSESKSKFYSNVFEYLASLMFLGVSFVTIFSKVIFKYLFAPEYYDAWIITPFLLLGAVFSSFSAFLGTNYIAAKKTKGVFRTSVIGGIISLLLNIIFIPFLGIIGAGISSMVSFFVMFIIRYIDTKQFISMRIDWYTMIKNIVLILIQMFILIIGLPQVLELILECILLLILLIINKKLLKAVLFIIQNLKKKITKNRKN